MRFTIQLPVHRVECGDEFTGPEAIASMAAAAEAAGYDACSVTDHPFPSAAWLDAGGHHALDPFVALSFAAAATRTIRLQTYLLVLPYRNPFLTAKAIASLDVLSRGRVIAGAAAGYLEGEFEALGADFAARNEVADETLRAMRAAFSGEGVRFEGRGYRAQGNRMLPRPVQRPAPPIWIGGNSRRAIRRAAELGDGWMPFPSPPGMAARTRTAVLAGEADLRERIGWLREAAARAQRSAPLDICMVPFGSDMYAKRAPEPEAQVEAIGRLERLGVTWTTAVVPGETRAEFLEGLQRHAEQVVLKLRPPRAAGTGGGRASANQPARGAAGPRSGRQ